MDHPVALVVARASHERDLVVAGLRGSGYIVNTAETQYAGMHYTNLPTRVNLVLVEYKPDMPFDLGRAFTLFARIAGFPFDAMVLWACSEGKQGWSTDAVRQAEAIGFAQLTQGEEPAFVKAVRLLHDLARRAI